MLNQNKALNAAINHLYFNSVVIEKIKLAESSYISKERKYLDLIDKKYDSLKKARSDKVKEGIVRSINNLKTKLEEFRNFGNGEAREAFKSIIATTEQTNLRDYISSNYSLASDTKDRLIKKAMQDFYSDIDGVLRGERSIRVYKKSNPLYIRGRSLNLYKNKDEYYIKWINGVVFKCILAAKRQNSLELEKSLDNIILSNYEICDSSIEFNKNDLVLNLSFKIPQNENIIIDKIPGRVVGVDLGLKIPAYCCLNDKPYIHKCIGNINDLLKVRVQMQNRRRNLQKSLLSTAGGKGKNKKLKALDQFKEKEKNYAKAYNHYLSSSIVKFAMENQASQINLECLNLMEIKNKSVLRSWTYSELQRFIEYKAENKGIKVQYIDPFLTSQVCSNCGNFDINQRISQSDFLCNNCGFRANADYNAARNISKSNRYIIMANETVIDGTDK